MSQGTVLSQFGSTYMLPLGTTRNDYEVDKYKWTWNIILNGSLLSGIRRSRYPARQTGAASKN